MTKKRIEFAATNEIDQYPEEIGQILQQFALLYKEPDESVEQWVQYAFVSDEARLADFISEESDLSTLGNAPGMPNLSMRDFIWQLARTLHERSQYKF